MRYYSLVLSFVLAQLFIGLSSPSSALAQNPVVVFPVAINSGVSVAPGDSVTLSAFNTYPGLLGDGLVIRDAVFVSVQVAGAESIPPDRMFRIGKLHMELLSNGAWVPFLEGKDCASFGPNPLSCEVFLSGNVIAGGLSIADGPRFRIRYVPSGAAVGLKLTFSVGNSPEAGSHSDFRSFHFIDPYTLHTFDSMFVTESRKFESQVEVTKPLPLPTDFLISEVKSDVGERVLPYQSSAPTLFTANPGCTFNECGYTAHVVTRGRGGTIFLSLCRQQSPSALLSCARVGGRVVRGGNDSVPIRFKIRESTANGAGYFLAASMYSYPELGDAVTQRFSVSALVKRGDSGGGLEQRRARPKKRPNSRMRR